MSNEKYAANRALLQLDEQRMAADWAGDTALLPKIEAPLPENDDTVPMLPKLLRPQA